MAVSSSETRQKEVPRLPAEPDPEYLQTAVVSFAGLAGEALGIYLKEIAPAIRSGATDQEGNDRLVAVVPASYTEELKQAHEAGFRTAEIDNANRLVGLELVPEGDRTSAVRVGTGLEIIQIT